MAAAELDVVGIGNAIVDVIAKAEDKFLLREGIEKGAMTLIDADRAEALYSRMGPAIETSGGSAANTIAGIASLGGKAAFIGKVHDDTLGRVFAHDIRALGVTFATPFAKQGAPTARCLILVTPDAQRSMSTYLGACQDLTPDDVDPALIARAQILYLEGYLWDPPQAKAAFRRAIDGARAAGRRVALSLSDPFCVARYRDDFRALLDERKIDILFANEREIESLWEVPNFDAALQLMRGRPLIAALTRSEKGSVIAANGETHVIDAEHISTVVDTTGAGDLYAAGFLYGLARGFDLARCGKLGSLCAGEAVSHLGPRPETSLAKLASAKGFL